MQPFKSPAFQDGDVELRCEKNEIAIYGTPEGLIALADLCRKLADAGAKSSIAQHIHLEDRGLLAKDSLPGVVAVFRRTGHG